jgi:hypothetical protein
MGRVQAIEASELHLREMLQAEWLWIRVGFEVCLRSLNRTKRYIGEQVRHLLVELKQLEKWLEVSDVLSPLREVRERLRTRGRSSLYGDLRTSFQRLQCAVTRRLSYSFHALTLNRRTVGDYRQVVKDSKSCVTAMMKGMSFPGSGAVVRFPHQPNVHAHLLYWGPPVREEELAGGWLAVTQDSNQVDARLLPGRPEVERWVGYMCYQKVDDACWRVTRPLRLWINYGVFHGTSPVN